MQQPDIIVIGAGPAGLLAAGQAAALGANVCLLEKMEKPARKLRITGKGRCNITNVKPWDEFEKHIFPVSRLFKPSFMNFPNTDLEKFLNRIGLETVVERGDRLFPASSRAQDVADVLVRWAQQQGVDIRCNTEVLHFAENENRITAVDVRQNGQLKKIAAHSFIVATGGLSYPATGSTGDGFRWAQETGHTITALRPSLVALTVDKLTQGLEDLTLRNVIVKIEVDGRAVDEEFGDLTFTNVGIEGPIVLRLSRTAVDALLEKKKVTMELNCKPALSALQIQARLQREQIELGPQTLAALLRKWLPAQLIPAFIQETKLLPNKSNAKLTPNEILKISSSLQSWPINISGFGGYERAVITAGGVSMKDIDFKTMRSRKKGNLFFAGEILDLDADTGGYNLQIAFSTGYLAGISAAKQVFENK